MTVRKGDWSLSSDPKSHLPEFDITAKNKVVEVDGTKVKLQIWDTAGQERFKSIGRAYYRDAEALLLVYDITNHNSFENIRNWLTEIKEHAGDDTIIMLLGNKADVLVKRVIKTEQGQKLADELGIPFMETSAKTGQNVDLAFNALAKTLKEVKCVENGNHHRDGRKSLQQFLLNHPSGGDKCSC
ncbi:RAB37 [Bugula neritina]|uniref:RAB37 n=1 Tax=Bugula neritina TaxID=10212 RepID=A0A7J7KTK1_BUGNE|nr:RAB37 [Bugula neritina]